MLGLPLSVRNAWLVFSFVVLDFSASLHSEVTYSADGRLQNSLYKSALARNILAHGWLVRQSFVKLASLHVDAFLVGHHLLSTGLSRISCT